MEGRYRALQARMPTHYKGLAARHCGAGYNRKGMDYVCAQRSSPLNRTFRVQKKSERVDGLDMV